MQLLRFCFQRRNAYRVTDISPLPYSILHYVRAASNITTVIFDADNTFQLIMLWFSCDYIVLQYSYHRLYTCSVSLFPLCLVKGTHRERVQLVAVNAPDVAPVDGTLSMTLLNMSRIHNSKSALGRWLLLTGCVSSDKSAMAS